MSRIGRGFRLTHERGRSNTTTKDHDHEVHADDERAAGHWDLGQVAKWAPEDLKAHIGFMKTLDQELKASGELVAAEGLAGPDQAQAWCAPGKDGSARVTDGPFPETKEFLAGFWIVDVDGPSAPTRSPRVLGGARPGRQAAEHADRGAPGDERACHRTS